VMLLFHACLIDGLGEQGSRGLRIRGRNPGMRIAQIIEVEAAGQSVSSAGAGLQLEKVAEAGREVGISVSGQFRADSIEVIDVDRIVKPDLSFANRPRQDESRVEFV